MSIFRRSQGPFCGDNSWHNVWLHALPPRIPHWLRPPTRPASALREPGRLALSSILLTISWTCFLQQLARCHHLFSWWRIHWHRIVLELQTVELHFSAWCWPGWLKQIQGAILLLLNHGPPTNEGSQGGGHLAHQKLQHEKTRFLFEHLLPRSELSELQTPGGLWVGKGKVFWGRRVL